MAVNHKGIYAVAARDDTIRERLLGIIATNR